MSGLSPLDDEINYELSAAMRAVRRADRVITAWGLDMPPLEGWQTTLQDALTDLRHWADVKKLNFELAVEKSAWMHGQEVDEPWP